MPEVPRLTTGVPGASPRPGRRAGVVPRARAYGDAGPQPQEPGRRLRHHAGRFGRAQHAGQHPRVEPLAGVVEHLGGVPLGRRGPPGRARSIAAVGHAGAGEPLGEEVVREPDGPGGRRRLRLHPPQPGPLGGGERGHRHQADPARPTRRPRRSRRPSAAASSADSVSFQSFAGRSGRPAPSSTTRPCCWPATEMAAISAARPVWRRASRRACHQTSGSVSRAPPVPVTVCGARPRATTVPVSASTTTTLVDCVEASTPATRGIALLPAQGRLGRAPRRLGPLPSSLPAGPGGTAARRAPPASARDCPQAPAGAPPPSTRGRQDGNTAPARLTPA